MKLLVSWFSLALCLAAAPQWKPATFADQGTVEFLTVVPDEGEHWSTVWFVVIGDAVYFRLGPRAVNRIDKNSTAPLLKLRVSAEEVHTLRYEKAPEMAEKVAAAMAEKYWTDFLGEPFRKLGLSAPAVMLRLVPEGGASAS
jgi:hypothetical protein